MNITHSEKLQVTLQVWQWVWCSLILIMGLFGNFMVFLVICKSEEAYRTSPFNKCILSLAIADFLLAIFSVSAYILSKSDFSHPDGLGGDVLCKLFIGYFITFWIAGVSVFMLVIISLERLRAVSQPLIARISPSPRKTNVAIASAWIGAFIIQTPTMIGIRYNPDNPSVGKYCEYHWEHKMMPHIIYVCYVSIQYFIPLIILFITFIRIRHELLKLTKTRRSDGTKTLDVYFQASTSSEDLEIDQCKVAIDRRRRSVRVVLTVVMAFLICWTPDHIMFFLFQYKRIKAVQWNSTVFQFGLLLCFTNSCINPILYAFQAKEFRNRCRNLLSGFFK